MGNRNREGVKKRISFDQPDHKLGWVSANSSSLYAGQGHCLPLFNILAIFFLASLHLFSFPDLLAWVLLCPFGKLYPYSPPLPCSVTFALCNPSSSWPCSIPLSSWLPCWSLSSLPFPFLLRFTRVFFFALIGPCVLLDFFFPFSLLSFLAVQCRRPSQQSQLRAPGLCECLSWGGLYTWSEKQSFSTTSPSSCCLLSFSVGFNRAWKV